MSTKIYNGFRFAGVKSVNTAFDILREMAPQFRAMAKERAIVFLVNRATNLYDLRKANPEERQTDVSVLTNADMLIRRDLKEAQARNATDLYDFGMSVTLAPVNGRVIGILYANNREMGKAFTSHKAIRPYGYWDNTDEEEGVSEKEWSQRRGDWSQVLPSYLSPSEEMLSYVFVHDYQFPSISAEECANYVTPKATRLQWMAERAIKHSKDISALSSGEYIRYVMSGEYKSKITEWEAANSHLVETDLTIDNLLERI